ncbi:MAG TPA: TatD family hydrolase [Patescibacteria group bacterium]|jgi:TatD DNase family protein
MSNLSLVDTHVHLDFDQFAADRDEVLARAADAGVTRLINVGTSLAASEQCVRLAEEHPSVWAVVGVHPADAGDVDGPALDRLKELAAHPRVVAVGEIGFDYFRDTNPPADRQHEAFAAQREIARSTDLPIIVHLREPDPAALAALLEPPVRGVVHCYTGNLVDAERLLAAGYLISFTAPVTYPKNDALREVVKAVPLDRIMVETDCPFLPPPDKRGERNEPAYVVETAKKIAEIKGISLDEVARATTVNAERLFGLD